ncbi:hypothetical protein PI125_g3647 [Phytophthora idaei]|nr:hypothetical protein PI125_g3647 [Phytophthora idaei]
MCVADSLGPRMDGLPSMGTIERFGGYYIACQAPVWVDQTVLVNWLNWYFPDGAKSTGQYVVWDSMKALTAISSS